MSHSNEIFRVHDLVVLKEGGSVQLTCETVLAALEKRPLKVVAVISAPLLNDCDCRGIPHGLICASRGEPWGDVRHPQWLIVCDVEGNILYELAPSGVPMRLSGAWFTRVVVTTTLENSGVQ